MANDAARGQVVLFGGWDGISHFGDTWTWDGATWTEQHPRHSPHPRRSLGMAYDPVREEVVLFGGYTDEDPNVDDTWTWDGTDWTRERPGASPSARSIFGMAFHKGTRQLVVFGGEGSDDSTWVWNGRTWRELVPVPGWPEWRQLQGMSRDGNHVLMFGGEVAVFEDYWIVRETWTWDGRTWRRRRPDTSPSAREAMGLAYDIERDNVVLFGGANYEPLGDTWLWDGGSWGRRLPDSSPLPRERMGMAYDSARDEIVLFGGTQYFDECFFGDTWTWDGQTWTEH